MLRVESEDGWWLITHPDHARLAAEFACHWGNDLFAAPEPRSQVLHGISVHDDGWEARDHAPIIKRDGTPSAFSHETSGGYYEFDHLNLAEYLTHRERAAQKLEAENPYAGLLVSIHIHNLLTARTDRSKVAPEELPLLDEFLERQRNRLERLRTEIRRNPRLPPRVVSEQAVLDNFRLLQATDKLSLLSCVGAGESSTLLHPLRKTDGSACPIHVVPLDVRRFLLRPYPFKKPTLEFEVTARHVKGKRFQSSRELTEHFRAAQPERLHITITSKR